MFARGQAILEKGQKRAKGPNKNFGARQVLFGTKFLKFGPKRANLATLIASRQKQIMTSQNRLTRPFCKPPANLQHTLHAVVHLHSNVLSSAAQPLKMQRSTERE